MTRHDRRALRTIRDSALLTDRQKAEMLAPCPLCASRPGRACRNRAGRPTFHVERLEAWLGAPLSRPQSATLHTVTLWHVIAYRHDRPASALFLADLVTWTTARLTRSPAEAVTFRKEIVAARQAESAARALGPGWRAVAEAHR